MTDKEVVLAVLKALDEVGIAYMIVGSLASNAYGIPRSTQDADIVMDASSSAISQLSTQLPDSLVMDSQLTFETVTGTHRVIVTPTRSKFKVELFLTNDDPHDRERFSRKVRGQTYGQDVWLPTPEDVVITKLRWSRHGKRLKDIDDVRNVIAVQGEALDWAYILRWCDEHGTRELLKEIRASIPGS